METSLIEKTIVRLPSMVDDRIDLAAINQQLREKSAALDWSGVVSAPENNL